MHNPPRVAKDGGKLYQGRVDSAESVVARWYRGEAETTRQCHADEDTARQRQGVEEAERTGGGTVPIQLLHNCRSYYITVNCR